MKTKIWIARDENGLLYLYNKKPRKYKFMFVTDGLGKMLEINKNTHPEVTWENSPQQIEI